MSMELYIKKGGSLTQEKGVTCGQEILKLLEAVWVPKQAATTHCIGHLKEETTAVRGN
jgi:hypothetical protein